MKAARFVTTYCRKTGGTPTNTQRIAQLQFEDNQEDQVIEMWLRSYLECQQENISQAI